MSNTKTYAVVAVSVGDLVPYERNSRTHSEAQIAQIAASIKEFGFTNPVLIDETNVIIAGEGRVRAAKKLALENVPCIVLTGLTEAQKAAYVIADNKIALNSGWDTDMLLEELDRIASRGLDMDIDLALTGFTEVEILKLIVDDTSEEDEGSQPDWGGMPEFNQPSDKPFRTVLVHLNDQASVDAFAKQTGLQLTDKTKYVWFPKQPKVAKAEAVYA